VATPTDTSAADAWLSAVTASHRRVADLVAPLSDDEVARPSYADEWSIADVLSHLGSGAEIFSAVLAAGVAGREAPGIEEFQPIWARWNAKSPSEQVHDAIAADAAFLADIDALDAEQRASWRIEMFGSEQDLAGLLRFRLGEHALHTWDVAVMHDPEATVAPDAVDLLVDTLEVMVQHAGKPIEEPVAVLVITEAPARQLLLQAGGDGVTLSQPDAGDAAATVTLPAEAFVRLVYGRLDDDHTPPLDITGVDLDNLRRAFPGF
jgi:uncharacterized protein (TIGR03083 family)